MNSFDDSKLITLYHADDNDKGEKFVRFADIFLDYFDIKRPVLEVGSIKFTDINKAREKLSEYLNYQPSTSEYYAYNDHYEDVIKYLKSTDSMPDIVIVDMRWRFEDGTVDNSAGVKIINTIFRRDKKTFVYTNTAFPGDTLHGIAAAAKEYHIDPIDYSELEQDIRDELPKALRRIARKYIRKSTPEEKDNILNIVGANGLSKEDLLDTEIRVNGQKWQIKNLFLCTWDPEKCTYVDLQKTIKDITTTDVTLAYSRAFAIWGLKAITHDDAKYFPDDSVTITEKARQQIGDLKKVVSNVPSGIIGECDKQKLSEYNIPSSSTSFDSQLRNDRQNYFQFQGEADTDGINGSIANTLTRTASKHNVGLIPFKFSDTSWTDASIELHLPVHKYYEDHFENMFESIKRKTGQDEAEVTFYNYATSHSEQSEGYKSKVYKNLIIIRNEGNVFHQDNITGKDTATLVSCFSSANFGWFGKFYLAVSSDGTQPCTLFDCTFSPATKVKVAEVFTESPELRDQLKNPAGYVTYYLFVFSCWRPQPKSKA